jgi:hypothetical protein
MHTWNGAFIGIQSVYEAYDYNWLSYFTTYVEGIRENEISAGEEERSACIVMKVTQHVFKNCQVFAIL